MNFPSGAFEGSQPVTVSTTSLDDTAADFEETAALFEPGPRLSYEVRIHTDQRPPLTDLEAVFIVPETVLSSLPENASIRMFVQILGGGNQEVLDTFESFPSTFDRETRQVRAVLPKEAFTDLRSSDDAFEAVIVLAASRAELSSLSGVRDSPGHNRGSRNAPSKEIISPTPAGLEQESSSMQRTEQAQACKGLAVGSPLKRALSVTHRFDGKVHFGTDFDAGDTGDEVLAVADAEVVQIGWNLRKLGKPDPRTGLKTRGWGRYVHLKHSDGWHSLYAHLQEKSTAHLHVGDKVRKGAVLGEADSTGGTTGSHLHLEYFSGGDIFANVSKIDPEPCIVAAPALKITQIAIGTQHTYTLLSDATLKCLGGNVYGQLGTGNTADSSTPLLVPGLTGVTSVGAQAMSTCAVLKDGALRCWGDNYFGELGNGSTVRSPSPSAVVGISNAVSVAPSAGHTCAIVGSGQVYCWGTNYEGQLGDGTTKASLTPVAVPGISDAVSVAASTGFSCAARRAGPVVCWGNGANGLLGTGSEVDSLVPVAVSGLANATAVSTRMLHTCALLSDGKVMCWGLNGFGQLGDGTTVHSKLPVTVKGISSAMAVAVGSYFSCAVLSDGTVWCWGNNVVGELGTGARTGADLSREETTKIVELTSFPTAAPVVGVKDAVAIAAGNTYVCAALKKGTVVCWGRAEHGQFGEGVRDAPTPIAIKGLP